MATRHILADVATLYEAQVGCRILIDSVGGLEATRRVRASDQMDIVVLASTTLVQLEAEGHIVAGSRADVARSGMAIAVRANAPRPPIDTKEAVRQTILDARTIGYSTGPSGDHLKQLWERWGIAEKVAPRSIQAPAGVPVATLVARGDADLGFQQLSELLDAPGIDILGPLPPDIQTITVFSAGVARTSWRTGEARAMIEFLVSSAADEAKLRHGMKPAKRMERQSDLRSPVTPAKRRVSRDI